MTAAKEMKTLQYTELVMVTALTQDMEVGPTAGRDPDPIEGEGALESTWEQRAVAMSLQNFNKKRNVELIFVSCDC